MSRKSSAGGGGFTTTFQDESMPEERPVRMQNSIKQFDTKESKVAQSFIINIPEVGDEEQLDSLAFKVKDHQLK